MTIHTVCYTYILHYVCMAICLCGYVYLWLVVLLGVGMVGIMRIRQYLHTHGNT